MKRATIFLILIIALIIPSYLYSTDASSEEYALQSLRVIETMEDALYDLNTVVDMIYIMTDRQCLKHLYDIQSEWRVAGNKLQLITPPAEAQHVHSLMIEALGKYIKSTDHMIKSCRNPFSKNEYFSEGIFLMRQGDRLFSKVRDAFGKIAEEPIYSQPQQR
jgi:hypothetical protein